LSGTQVKPPRAQQKKGYLFGEAKAADKYRLYQIAVQDPETDVELANRIFKKAYGRAPRILREDFCGSSAISCCWVKSHAENIALGVDLDPEPLEWCRNNNFLELTPEQRGRVHLFEGDVRTTETVKTDVTCAFNFSYFLFKTRRELREYFNSARRQLQQEGLLMLDIYGGADAQRTLQENREQDNFDYVWDQHRFDPIHHHAVNYIHFSFPDGSKLKKAFHYEWRLWSIPELTELLEEVGFSKVEVYWEGTDKETGEGDGIYHVADKAADDPAWISYIVAYN